jgi:membrane associated rhomboid family serine protease
MSKITTANTRLLQKENSSFCLSIFIALIIPLVFGLFTSSIVSLIYILFWLAILLCPIILISRMIWDWVGKDNSILYILMQYLRRYLRFVPPGIIYNSDTKQKGFPIITISIISLNFFIFITLPDSFIKLFCFLPYGDPTIIDILISIFTCAFLHANFSHIAANMLFLWTFGSVLETRIGWRRFSLFYFSAIIGSSLLSYILLLIQSHRIQDVGIISNFHSIGASGAVAGIMGLFIVRCYFSTVTMSAPLIIFPFSGFLSFPLRLQAPVLVGFFFIMDISGSVDQFQMKAGNIDHWAHVGGYLTCTIIGLCLRLHREAVDDAIQTRAVRYTKDEYRLNDAETNYQYFLEKSPENLEALSFLFLRHHKRQSKDAGPYYARLLSSAIKSDLKKAAELSRDYIPQYLPYIPLDLSARLGSYFYRNSDLNMARLFLERVVNTEGIWQPKAMLLLAQTFIGIGNNALAGRILTKVIERFSGTLFENEAERLLSEF